MSPSGRQVRAMFSEIAPRYDLLNRLLSLGIDRRWRRRTVRRLNLAAGARVLDLCCGTGDLALAFARTGCAVTGADFAGPMLPRARKKAAGLSPAPAWLQADAQALPFADGAFDAVTIAFGIRNVEDPRRGLAECARVLAPGGRLAILEFFEVPGRVWGPVFRFYFHRVLPRIARLARGGRNGAYEYLPASVEGFARPEEFCGWVSQAGFDRVEDLPLTGGVARLVTARRAGERG